MLGEPAEQALPGLSADDQRLDRVLAALYDAERSGGLEASAPGVARWLGDIRAYFPSSVVRVMQQDALERLGLTQLLLEPELLSQVEPDMHLVTTLVSLSRVIPARTRETARIVVRRVVEDIERRLAEPLRQAVHGALNRSLRNPDHACARSTGSARCAPTSSTICRSSARSCPNGWSATVANASD